MIGGRPKLFMAILTGTSQPLVASKYQKYYLHTFNKAVMNQGYFAGLWLIWLERNT